MTEVAAELADATLVQAAPAVLEAAALDAEIHTLGIVRAVPLSTNRVAVELSNTPLDVKPFTPGGITNPKNWTITPYEPTARARLVQLVELYLDAATVEASPEAVRLSMLTPPFVVVSFDGPLPTAVRHKLTFSTEPE